MRIAPDQLGKHLERELRALYVLVGDEPLACMESADAIRAAARHRGFDERCVFTADARFDWNTLALECRTVSLFSPKRILEIRIPSGKPGAEGSRALQACIAAPPADILLLVVLPKLDGAAQSSSWFTALEQSGIVVPLLDVELGQLPAWIGQRLKQQGQQADAATLDFIAHQVEGNLLAAHQEIRKLGLLFPKGPLQPDATREAVLNVSRHDAFQLGDALLAGNVPRTARILQGLEAEGMQPVALLGMLAWLMRGVVRAKQAEAQGENLANALREVKIYGGRQTLIRQLLGRTSMRQLQFALAKLAEIDRISKGIAPGRPWMELSRLCTWLARTGVRHKVAA